MTSPDGDDKRLQRFVDAVVAIGATAPLDEVLQQVVVTACEMVGARYGALGVLRGDGGLRQFVHHGMDSHTVGAIGDLPEGKGILGVLIEDPRPLRLQDLGDHPDSYGFPANHPPMGSFLGVPITARGRVFGNLYLTEKEGGGDFTETDEELAVALATAAGVTIDNAFMFEDSARREARLAVLQDITSALLAGASADDVLGMAAASARELVEADLAYLMLPQGWPSNGEGAPLSVVVADGHGADRLRGELMEVAHSLSGQAVEERRVVVSHDAASDERAAPVTVDLGVGPFVSVPLRSQRGTFGALTVANVRGQPRFDDSDVHLLQAFADQASVVVEYARVRFELERLAIVEDRERIARDLHDTVIQQLFATGMMLQSAQPSIHDGGVRARLDQAVDSLDRTIRDIRSAIFALQAHGQSGRGLKVDLLRLLGDASGNLGFEPTVSFEGSVEQVPESVTADALAVVREALTNASKHASATSIDVRVAVTADQLGLTITDDGEGIDDDAEASTTGHGLANLRRRAESRGGSFSATAGTTGGSVVAWRVPLVGTGP